MKPCLSAQSVGLKAFFKFTVCGNRSGGEELSGFKTLLISYTYLGMEFSLQLIDLSS